MSSIYLTHPAFTRWRTARAGLRGVAPSTYWQAIAQRDPDLRSVVLCVELVLGEDTVVRVANRPCGTRSKMTGEEQQWVGALSDDVSLTMDYQFGQPSSTAKSISITLPNELANCAAIIKAGRLLAGVAEVSLNVDGGDYDQRLTLIRGDIDDGVEFGARTQLVRLSITDPASSVDTQLPPYVLDVDRFASLPADSTGARLPVVLPLFGALPAVLVGASATTPTYACCHGHLTISTVYVDGTAYTAGDAYYPWQELHEQDALGEPYTQLRFTGGLAGFSGNEAVYVALTGGYSDGKPTNIVRSLVEQYSALGVEGMNGLLFARAEAALGSMTARCAANASGSNGTTTLAFIEGELLASFPMVTMVWDGGAYGPVVTSRRGSPVARLVADQWPLLDRATSVTELGKADIFNSFVLQYGYDPLTDSYTGVVQRNPTNSTLCSISRMLVGERQADTLVSLWITDEGVANAVVDWMADHLTLPSYRVDYEASPWVLLHLRRGDNVLLTDEEFGWSQTQCTVESITYTPARCVLGLRVWARYYQSGGGSYSVSGATGGGGGQGGNGGGGGGQ